uniref:MICOS complex subunit MIC13 n=1 Tax=Saimiri boliviensis boliviensis TaxID=39432 RepID=A0A2K6S626_SAIBB
VNAGLDSRQEASRDTWFLQGWKALETSAPHVPTRRFLIKGSVAGGAVYLVYDQELLGSSDKSQAALKKAGEVVPPAMYQFSQYVCQQTGLQIPQLPAPPKIHFPIRDSWNAGIITVMSALSVAPSKACEYSKEGWEYVKARAK